MEDFIKKYMLGDVNPLALLMAYADGKDEVIETILTNESLGSVYDVSYIDKINKSLQNIQLREEGYNQILVVLKAVAKEFLEEINKNAKEVSSAILEEAKALDSMLDDYSGPDEIIAKLKIDNVLKEYLPQAMDSLDFDMDEIYNSTALTFITEKDIKSILNELSSFREVLKNVAHLAGDEDIDIEGNLVARYNTIKERINGIMVRDERFKPMDCKYSNFINLTDIIRDLHDVIKDTFKALNGITEQDLVDINGQVLSLTTRIDNGEFNGVDEYMFNKVYEFHIAETELYKSIFAKVKEDLVIFNKAHASSDKVLNKINL